MCFFLYKFLFFVVEICVFRCEINVVDMFVFCYVKKGILKKFK